MAVSSDSALIRHQNQRRMNSSPVPAPICRMMLKTCRAFSRKSARVHAITMRTTVAIRPTTTWSCSAKCDGSVAADKICGGKNVSTASTLGLGTCAETKKAIFDVPKYATSAHMVPCDPGYCKMCTAAGEKTMMGSTVTCYNNSVTMYANKTDANDHALARGCKGSHEMMSKFMPGETHALCASGKNYFDDIPVASGAGGGGAAAALFSSVVVAGVGGFLVDRLEVF